MKTQFSDSGYGKFFLWVSKAKFTMGVFYVAYTMVYLFFGLLAQGPSIALGLLPAIEMLLACFLIGIAQQIILPVDKLNKTRCVLWVAVGFVITLGFSLGFGWFKQFPGWCLPVFILVLVLGMAAATVSYYLELHRETRLLNRKLQQFQNNKSQEH